MVFIVPHVGGDQGKAAIGKGIAVTADGGFTPAVLVINQFIGIVGMRFNTIAALFRLPPDRQKLDIDHPTVPPAVISEISMAQYSTAVGNWQYKTAYLYKNAAT